jgi:hypothetical protein
MTILLIGLVIAGFAGIILGGLALRPNRRNAPQRHFAAAIVIGVCIGFATWPLTIWMAYPFEVEGDPGYVVGIPFFVAYFDSAGRDYVGPLTLPATIGNCLFWFFVPQLVLFAIRRRSSKGVMV